MTRKPRPGLPPIEQLRHLIHRLENAALERDVVVDEAHHDLEVAEQQLADEATEICNSYNGLVTEFGTVLGRELRIEFEEAFDDIDCAEPIEAEINERIDDELDAEEVDEESEE